MPSLKNLKPGSYQRAWRKKYHLTSPSRSLLLRLPVGRGGVINSPRSVFLGFFSVSEVGLPLMGDTAGTKTAFNGGICQQNKHFNMYTTIYKPQEAQFYVQRFSSKMFYNDKFHREALARGGELWECVSNACFCHLPLCFHLKFYTSIKPIFYWIIFTKHNF